MNKQKHTKNSLIYKEEHPYDNHRYKCSVCEYEQIILQIIIVILSQ